ncbi:MAG: triosephosphate isomerase [Candidatus Pacebacteria bacterium]|nr:triosephosphate isomerase [Candidatus Paceibacterota bacterium]PIR60258.1 MAG: triose-phosphate isomerase [Candidatus Pacebacteria bacterium CG10_big_fil_rev_8_21_14_0_10_44_54]
MKRYVIANWKSNKTVLNLQPWLAAFGTAPAAENLEIIIAPSHTSLALFQEFDLDQVQLAAQDVSPFPLGAYTGAVAAQQLADLGVRYCLVGHSERRKYFHETDQDVAKKITELFSVGIVPILCLDEPYITSQAQLLSDEQRNGVLLAYEPGAAIGSGYAISVDHVEHVSKQLREYFSTAPILYGGSVDEQNCDEFLLVTNGILVGTASLDAKQFATIVAKCAA